MRRLQIGLLSLLVLTAAFTVLQPKPAEARRGGGLAFGIAAAVIGGVIVHQALRNRDRRRYRRSYSYRPVYYRPAYYVPARSYRYRSYRRHRSPRCIWRHGRRYCR